jgi:CubicO group peptidase (beta-lactamase class C family)
MFGLKNTVVLPQYQSVHINAFIDWSGPQLVEPGCSSYRYPSWQLTPKDTAGTDTNHLTLRDLMSHRTGLPRHDFSGFTSRTREQLLGRLKFEAMDPDKPIRYTPGEYNNEMFVSAGVAAATALRKTWEEAVFEEIFKPLNMSSTYSNFSSVPSQVKKRRC